MPIGGFVINVDPDTHAKVIDSIAEIPHLDVHGSDEKGNIVAVIDTETTKEMQQIVDQLNELEYVLTVGLTYINVEDEEEGLMKRAGQEVFYSMRDKEISV
jgi:nitrate reductase NapAB chaperone NapD